MFPTPGKPALVLAPMEGLTDSPMRAQLTREGHFTYCVTEFLRVSAEVPPDHIILRYAPEAKQDWRTPSGCPLQLQLLGGNPELMAETAKNAVALGAPAIDINFGCPAPTVNRHDGGATLLKYPDRIEAIVAAIRAAVPETVPVSAKMRLGWEDPQDLPRNAEAAARGGANWITIHARTKMQGYMPPAHWQWIGIAKRALRIPVIANGDIWTREDFLRCREETGCEHFMLGRGAVAYPVLSWQLAAELGLRPPDAPIPEMALGGWGGRISRFVEHCRAVSEQESYALNRSKQWLRLAASRGTFDGFERVKRAAGITELLTELG